MPLITCEMRWFFDGRLPDEAARWFGGTAAPWREDRYLVLPGVADMGIKRRQGRLDIKGRIAVLGDHVVAPGIEGVAERWGKWSYDMAIWDRFRGHSTILVGKRRVQRHFLLSPGGSAQEVAQRDVGRRGFSLELTRLRLHGADHWSLAIEAAPDDATMLDELLRALGEVLQGLPQSLPLDHSRSYPAWLSSLG
jgi:hypothetical protein